MEEEGIPWVPGKHISPPFMNDLDIWSGMGWERQSWALVSGGVWASYIVKHALEFIPASGEEGRGMRLGRDEKKQRDLHLDMISIFPSVRKY